MALGMCACVCCVCVQMITLCVLTLSSCRPSQVTGDRTPRCGRDGGGKTCHCGDNDGLGEQRERRRGTQGVAATGLVAAFEGAGRVGARAQHTTRRLLKPWSRCERFARIMLNKRELFITLGSERHERLRSRDKKRGSRWKIAYTIYSHVRHYTSYSLNPLMSAK